MCGGIPNKLGIIPNVEQSFQLWFTLTLNLISLVQRGSLGVKALAVHGVDPRFNFSTTLISSAYICVYI